MIDTSHHIGILYVRIFIPAAQSLKDKRMVLRSLKDRVRGKFNVSQAEIEGQDKWQTATLAFAMVGNDQRYMEGALQNILSLLDSYHALEICEQKIEFF